LGRKRTRRWQYLYLCFVSLVFICFYGCAAINGIKNSIEGHEALQRSRKLLIQGDYDGALKENQKIISSANAGSPKDKALFNQGLIYAHFGNPRKDYQKALGCFEKLAREYPQSPLAEQARTWAGVLEVLGRETMRTDELRAASEHLVRGHKLLSRQDYEGALAENRKIVSMPDANLPKDEALFNLGLIYAHYDNPARDYQKSHRCFKKLISDYPHSPLAEQAKIWSDVLQILEKLKKLDMEIEQKMKQQSR
jgi:tetratricopeptide (TPR) repeat protein